MGTSIVVTIILFILLPIIVLGGLGFGGYKFYLIKFRTKRAEPNQALLITGRNVFTKEELDERIKMIEDINKIEKEKVEKENKVRQTKFNLEKEDIDKRIENPSEQDLLVLETLKVKQKQVFEPIIFTPLNPSNYTTAKIVRGGTIQLKFQQYAKEINLNSFQLNVDATDILVRGNDLINAKGVVQLSVGTTDIQLLRYSEQFLGKKNDAIQDEIREIISTHFRAILTTLTVEDINSNRESFNTRVKEIAQKDLDTLGFQLVNFGLISVTDSVRNANELGFLGNAEKIRKAIMNEKTAIVEAETTKNIEIEEAKNKNISLKERNILDIENANSQKEKEEKMSLLKREIAQTKAEAEKAEEREMLIQEKKIQEERNKVEQEKRQGQLQIALIDSDEKQKVSLKQAQIDLEQEQKLKEKIEVQNAIKLENAQNARAIKEEEAKARLEEEKAKIEAKALEQEKLGIAKGKAIAAEANAEAEAIRVRGKAQAEAEAAIADVKLKTQDIYLKELAIKTAPEIAKSIAESIGGIDSVKIISTGGDDNDSISGFTNSLTTHTAQTYTIMKELTGIDMAEIALNKSREGQTQLYLDGPGTKAVKETVSEKVANTITETVSDGVTDNTSETVIDNE